MKKVLSVFLSICMLLSITAAVDVSAYAAHYGDTQLIYCQEMPTAALVDGVLYLIQGKSGDGKQEPKIVKLASDVKEASSVYVDSDNYVIAILWLDNASVMHSYYFKNDSGKYKDKGYGKNVSGVSAVFDYGYLKDKCVYYPTYKNGKLSFKEAQYLGEEIGEKIKIHSKVKAVIGNAIVINKKSYFLGFGNVEVREYAENAIKRCRNFANLEATDSLFFDCTTYYAKGKTLYSSDSNEKIADNFKAFCDYATYETTDGKRISLCEKELHFTIDKRYIAKVSNGGTLGIYDTKWENEEVLANKKLKKISDNVENVYYAGFFDLCDNVGVFTGPYMFNDDYFSFYYSKKDGSFWVYYFDAQASVANGKSVCLIPKKDNLKKTSISSIKSASKGFTVKWKKNGNATGYEIQYSTDKSFKKSVKSTKIKKNGTTSKKFSKLKGNKKYYVRVRAYKMVNGKNYYSDWSKTVTVKTKK